MQIKIRYPNTVKVMIFFDSTCRELLMSLRSAVAAKVKTSPGDQRLCLGWSSGVISSPKINEHIWYLFYGSISFCSGNVVGQLPYTPGTPCTKCASGQGWCYKNLCSEYTRRCNWKKTSFPRPFSSPGNEVNRAKTELYLATRTD